LSFAFALLEEAPSFVGRSFPLSLPFIPKQEGINKEFIQPTFTTTHEKILCITHVRFLESEIIQVVRLLESEQPQSQKKIRKTSK
jgi:hypothetical protein